MEMLKFGSMQVDGLAENGTAKKRTGRESVEGILRDSSENKTVSKSDSDCDLNITRLHNYCLTRVKPAPDYVASHTVSGGPHSRSLLQAVKSRGDILVSSESHTEFAGPPRTNGVGGEYEVEGGTHDGKYLRKENVGGECESGSFGSNFGDNKLDGDRSRTQFSDDGDHNGGWLKSSLHRPSSLPLQNVCDITTDSEGNLSDPSTPDEFFDAPAEAVTFEAKEEDKKEEKEEAREEPQDHHEDLDDFKDAFDTIVTQGNILNTNTRTSKISIENTVDKHDSHRKVEYGKGNQPLADEVTALNPQKEAVRVQGHANSSLTGGEVSEASDLKLKQLDLCQSGYHHASPTSLNSHNFNTSLTDASSATKMTYPDSCATTLLTTDTLAIGNHESANRKPLAKGKNTTTFHNRDSTRMAKKTLGMEYLNRIEKNTGTNTDNVAEGHKTKPYNPGHKNEAELFFNNLKPSGFRLRDKFVPLQDRSESCLNEETRKIVKMLENDKVCKVPRPNVGLQDRLQSLMQRSGGKKTSNNRGPRVCSTLVKTIVKRTTDKIESHTDSAEDFFRLRREEQPQAVVTNQTSSSVGERKVAREDDTTNTNIGWSSLDRSQIFDTSDKENHEQYKTSDGANSVTLKSTLQNGEFARSPDCRTSRPETWSPNNRSPRSSTNTDINRELSITAPDINYFAVNIEQLQRRQPLDETVFSSDRNLASVGYKQPRAQGLDTGLQLEGKLHNQSNSDPAMTESVAGEHNSYGSVEQVIDGVRREMQWGDQTIETGPVLHPIPIGGGESAVEGIRSDSLSSRANNSIRSGNEFGITENNKYTGILTGDEITEMNTKLNNTNKALTNIPQSTIADKTFKDDTHLINVDKAFKSDIQSLAVNKSNELIFQSSGITNTVKEESISISKSSNTKPLLKKISLECGESNTDHINQSSSGNSVTTTITTDQPRVSDSTISNDLSTVTADPASPVGQPLSITTTNHCTKTAIKIAKQKPKVNENTYQLNGLDKNIDLKQHIASLNKVSSKLMTKVVVRHPEHNNYRASLSSSLKVVMAQSVASSSPAKQKRPGLKKTKRKVKGAKDNVSKSSDEERQSENISSTTSPEFPDRDSPQEMDCEKKPKEDEEDDDSEENEDTEEDDDSEEDDEDEDTEEDEDNEDTEKDKEDALTPGGIEPVTPSVGPVMNARPSSVIESLTSNDFKPLQSYKPTHRVSEKTTTNTEVHSASTTEAQTPDIMCVETRTSGVFNRGRRTLISDTKINNVNKATKVNKQSYVTPKTTESDLGIFVPKESKSKSTTADTPIAMEQSSLRAPATKNIQKSALINDSHQVSTDDSGKSSLPQHSRDIPDDPSEDSPVAQRRRTIKLACEVDPIVHMDPVKRWNETAILQLKTKNMVLRHCSNSTLPVPPSWKKRDSARKLWTQSTKPPATKEVRPNNTSKQPEVMLPGKDDSQQGKKRASQTTEKRNSIHKVRRILQISRQNSIHDLTPAQQDSRKESTGDVPVQPCSRRNSTEEQVHINTCSKQNSFDDITDNSYESKDKNLPSRRNSLSAHSQNIIVPDNASRGSCSRRGSGDRNQVGSRRNTQSNFSDNLLRKCLEVAIDKCEQEEMEMLRDPPEVQNQAAYHESLNKSLSRAVARKEVGKVRELLGCGANPNVNAGHMPALLRAAKDGALYVVQALVGAGADVDARSEHGNSALHEAARVGHNEVVVHLVYSNAFVDAINRNGVTPLQTALAHGQVVVAKTLIQLNADVHLQNKVGESALAIADHLGYVGLIGPSLELRRDSGPGTRAKVISTRIPVMVQLILGLEEGCPLTVENCLARGANCNTIVPLALHWPAYATVLHRAAHHGHDLIARLLLKAGADVNAKDVVGNTPLHAAAQAGHNRVVKVLLANGALIESTSRSGMTPLHRAASRGKELTCNLLIRRGADPRVEDSDGRTPADWAIKRDFKAIARKLGHRRRSSNGLMVDQQHKAYIKYLDDLYQSSHMRSSRASSPVTP